MPLAASPSMVVICFPSAPLTGKEQERVATPSIWTVQAPHCAMPQPYLVPVRPTCSRITHNSGVLGSTSISSVLPLMVRRAIASSLLRITNLVVAGASHRQIAQADNNLPAATFRVRLLAVELNWRRLEPPPQQSLRQSSLDAIGRERHPTNAHAGRIKDRVRDCGRDGADRGLTRAARWKIGPIDQHHVNCFWCFGDVENWISEPVDAGYVLVVELDLLPKRTADALHNVALDGLCETVGVDDLATVVCNRELARPDLPRGAID